MFCRQIQSRLSNLRVNFINNLCKLNNSFSSFIIVKIFTYIMTMPAIITLLVAKYIIVTMS